MLLLLLLQLVLLVLLGVPCSAIDYSHVCKNANDYKAGAQYDTQSTCDEHMAPANRVAAVLAGFLIASVAIEVFLHKLHHYFHHKHMVGMLDALEKIKDELMLVGTLSLILQLCQDDQDKP